MAKAFRQHGIDLRFAAKLRDGHEAIVKAGMASAYISPDVFAGGSGLTDEELKVIDETYGPPFLGQVAQSDIHLDLLFGRDELRKRQIVARVYGFWEEYLRQNRVDVFLVRETASFVTRTALNIGRRYGIPVYLLNIGPDNDHFIIGDLGEDQLWSELFDALRGPKRQLTPGEIDRVKKLISDRVTNRFGNRMDVHQRPGFLNTVRLILDSYLQERRIDLANDPIGVAQQRNRRQFAIQRGLGYLRRRYFRYARPAEEKFVYLPLPYSREGTNLSVAPFWSSNLVALAREIATALPAGWLLYVKEHPIVPGDLPLHELRALRSIPRVRLIHPNEPSPDLVRDASAIITFQGSAGWEAFLLKRPLIVLGGQPYFSLSDLVHRVVDVRDFAGVLAKVLRDDAEAYIQREDEWLWFIHTVLDTSPEGRFVIFEPPYMEMNEVNIRNVASAIAAKIRRAKEAKERNSA